MIYGMKWPGKYSVELSVKHQSNKIRKTEREKNAKKKCQDRDAVSQRKRQKGKKCGEIFPFKARDERQKCKINIKELYLKKVVFR